MIDGLSPVVDGVLSRARLGLLTARQLSDELSAAPTPTPPPPESPRFARRLLLAAVTLVIAATSLVFVGRLLLADAGSPILVPQTQTPGRAPVLPSSTLVVVVAPSTTVPVQPVAVTAVRSVDPFGEGEENDERLENVLDDDQSTVWRTERYDDPLPALKPGVGLAMEVGETATSIELVGLTEGVDYQIGWSEAAPEDPSEWELVVRGHNVGGGLALQLPARPAGWWAVWLTDLPPSPDGGHLAELSEVRFTR
jgi:hypothetical protein